MTPDEIRNLKPGPELDRAMAIALDYPTHDGAGGRIYQRGPEGAELLPAYSSTWTGLGLVVEAMERRGLFLQVLPLNHGGRFRVCFATADCITTPAVVAAGIIEAATKAALLALAAEKGQRP